MKKDKRFKKASIAESELVREWHPTKNGSLSPREITLGSRRKIWWLCPKNNNHEWEAPPKRRQKVCPYCSNYSINQHNCFLTTHPRLASEWHPTKNGLLTAENITANSKKRVWWQCAKDSKHVWQDTVASRSAGSQCLICFGKKGHLSNCLAIANPKLASEWHPKKNGKLTPKDVTVGANKKVWWQCPTNKDHTWQAQITNRHGRKSRCPDCFGTTKLKSGKSLAEKFPRLVKEWHIDKNSPVTPEQVSSGSQKKYWWICHKKHEWLAPVLARSSGHGCPYCSGNKVTPERSLAVKRPHLIKEWHTSKNGALTPADVSYRGHKQVWWKCPVNENHIWQAKVATRSGGENRKGTSCPLCYQQASDAENRLAAELEVIFPNLEQRKLLDGKEADIYIPHLKLIIEVDGGYWHRRRKKHDLEKNLALEKLGYNLIRLRGKGLQKISASDVNFDCKKLELKNIKNLLNVILKLYKEQITLNNLGKIKSYLKANFYVNEEGYQKRKTLLPGLLNKTNLKDSCPHLVLEWHPTKNGSTLPEHYTKSSGAAVWWKCQKGHEWKTKISSRFNGQGCPYCANKRICMDNCLATLCPEFAEEWHPTKNISLNLTPYTIGIGSNKKVWWQCKKEKEHVWQVSPDTRYREKTGCPYCSGRRVHKTNCLATVNPKLASEWHPTLNGPLKPIDVTKGSKKKVWWICKKNPNHTWDATVISRSAGGGCPLCSGRRVDKVNSLATVNPKLASEWHPTLNGPLTPYGVTRGSKKKVWWICENQHIYFSQILSRSSGHGCPECAKKIKSETARKRWAKYYEQQVIKV